MAETPGHHHTILINQARQWESRKDVGAVILDRLDRLNAALSHCHRKNTSCGQAIRLGVRNQPDGQGPNASGWQIPQHKMVDAKVSATEALRKHLAQHQAVKSRREFAGFESAGMMVAGKLLTTDPVAAMSFARMDPMVMRWIGRHLKIRQWIWIDGHLIDSTGQNIATESGSPLDVVCQGTPQIVQEIAETLPQRQKSDFLSYWYMVSEGPSGYAASDREQIYRDMRLLVEAQVPTSLGERLAACFTGGPIPSFETWRKNLSRVIHRCNHRPDWSAHLRQIGLESRLHAMDRT